MSARKAKLTYTPPIPDAVQRRKLEVAVTGLIDAGYIVGRINRDLGAVLQARGHHALYSVNHGRITASGDFDLVPVGYIGLPDGAAGEHAGLILFVADPEYGLASRAAYLEIVQSPAWPGEAP